MILFRSVAAAVLLSLQDTPQNWIRQLGSEDPKLRERASSRLLNEGEKSRALLEKAVGDKDPEISQRARGLLNRLNAKKVLPTSTGDLGKSGCFWLAKEAVPLLADDPNVPERMKPLLHGEAEATFAMIRIEDGKARLLDIVTARVVTPTPEQAERYEVLLFDQADAAPKLIRHVAHGFMDAGLEVNGQSVTWDYGWESMALPIGDWWKTADVRRPAELFRSWPDLKAASIVFVAPSNLGKSLQKGLLDALSHPHRDVRLAATVALGRYFTVESVQGLIGKLRDPDAGVVEAAAETLKTLAEAPKGSAEDVQKWWSAIKDADRKELLMKYLDRSTSSRAPGEFNRGQHGR